MKKRKRIKGNIAGLCSTYIAGLAGVAPVTVRRWRKGIKGEVTLHQLRRFIFEQEARKITESIRESIGADFSEFVDRIVQQ